MTASVKLFDSKASMTRDALADFLIGVGERVRAGEVALVQGDVRVPIGVADTVTLEVEARERTKRSGTKRKIELEFSWYVDGGPAPSGVSLG